jgi:adenine-specific DNA-methyltransferase
VNDCVAYDFIYERSAATTLDNSFLEQVKVRAGRYVVYADLCELSDDRLASCNITFKKIPRDIARI